MKNWKNYMVKHYFMEETLFLDEGGLTEGINISEGAKAIQSAMQKANPVGAIWVLQGWWDNPKDSVIIRY